MIKSLFAWFAVQLPAPYLVIASFESKQGIQVVTYQRWTHAAAFNLKLALDSWHLVGNGSGAVCCCSIISPNGGYI